jgi:translation initiation factor 2 beta subunit (eIF-2beta)/eIF-5
MTTTKRKSSNLFDTIESLERHDGQASSKYQRLLEQDQRKSKAAQSQTKLYEHLMEIRILLHRATIPSNQNNNNNDDDENKTTEKVKTKQQQPTVLESSKEQVIHNCHQLLEKLHSARKMLCHDIDNDDNMDDTDDTIDDTDDDDDNPKTLDKNWDTILSNEYNTHKQIWKNVLNQRHHDLRLHSGVTAKAQFHLLDTNFWTTQIETSTHVQFEQQQQKGQSSLDDSKLYQYMLQDFLLLKRHVSQDDNHQNTNHHRWKQGVSISKSSSVDRKASKGRKLRYAVYPKLVHFTFPQNRMVPSSSSTTTTTVMEEEEWFASLFGGATAVSATRKDGKSKRQRK